MVVIDKEPMEIILLTYFEIDSIVVGFNVYQSNQKPVTGEVLKTCMEPQNEVHKYAAAVVDNESNVTDHQLTKGKKGKYVKTILRKIHRE